MKNQIKKIIITSIIFSLIAYLIGIITGVKYGSEIIKSFQIQDNLTIIKTEISKLSEEIDNIKFLIFSESLSKDEKCKLLYFLLQKSENLLQEYYKTLPSRLEEYELKETVSKSYLEAKEAYQKLLINRWFVSKSYEKCNEKVISIIYFYKPNCEICVEQGKEIDKIRDYLKNLGYEVYVNTFDINFKDFNLEIIKNIYNISDAPSFIVGNISFPNFTSFETFKSYFEKA